MEAATQARKERKRKRETEAVQVLSKLKKRNKQKQKQNITAYFPQLTVTHPLRQRWLQLEAAITEVYSKLENHTLAYDFRNGGWRLEDLPLKGLLNHHRDSFYVPKEFSIWSPPPCRSGSSSSTGRYVEKEIQTLFEKCILINAQNVDSVSALPPLPEKLKLLPFTRKILAALWEYNIYCIAFQVPIVSREAGLLTYADAVGIQLGTGNLALLEFKTGYDYGYTQGRGALRFPPVIKSGKYAVADTDRNRHILQLVDTAAIGERWLGVQFDLRLLFTAHSSGKCEVFDASPDYPPQRKHWSRKYELTYYGDGGRRRANKCPEIVTSPV